MENPHLKQGYEQSKIPEGYDQHSAFLYPGGEYDSGRYPVGT